VTPIRDAVAQAIRRNVLRVAASDGERVALTAFVTYTVLAGGNAVCIRFSNRELAPLWGASLRFALAAALLLTLVLHTRTSGVSLDELLRTGIVAPDIRGANAINVMCTVREFESAGLAGIQIEDQVMPKKCGHTEGKLLMSKAEMVQKVKAAVDARQDPDFVFVVRTDAIAVNGLDDALDRALAYQEAGADVVFVEAPRTLEEMRRVCRTIKAPLLANMVEGGGKTPILPLQELKKMGYKMVIYPVSTHMAAIKAMQEVLAVLKQDGTTARFASQMVPFQEMFEVVGRSKFTALEKKYAS